MMMFYIIGIYTFTSQWTLDAISYWSKEITFLSFDLMGVDAHELEATTTISLISFKSFNPIFCTILIIFGIPHYMYHVPHI